MTDLPPSNPDALAADPIASEGLAGEGAPLIFVSDASVEAEGLTGALRSRGYVVVDVPLGLLINRVAVQRPALILCDLDAEGALETMARLRDIPGSGGVDVIFIAEAGRALSQLADQVAHESSGVFVRPVDVYALVRKVEGLIGPPRGRGSANLLAGLSSRAPVLVASSRKPYRYEGGRPSSAAPPNNDEEGSAPPPGSTPGSSGLPPHRASAAVAPASLRFPGMDPGAERPTPIPPPAPAPGEASQVQARALIPQSELSPQLQRLLADAEQRLPATPSSLPPPRRLAPEQEVEAVLPADVLAALDEPLALDEDDEEALSAPMTRAALDGELMEVDPLSRASPTDAMSRRKLDATTADGRAEPDDAASEARAASTSPPARREESVTIPPRPRQGVQTPRPSAPPLPEAPMIRDVTTNVPPSVITGVSSLDPNYLAEMHAAQEPPRPAPVVSGPSATHAAHSLASVGSQPLASDVPRVPMARMEEPSAAPLPDIAPSLGPGDAIRALARAIRARYTGALALEDESGIRRVLFRDGDFVIVASSVDDESLVSFLAQRGDLPADVAARLARRLPQFGRHAGAALIAHGHLRQDELWAVLRAHAEWLLSRIVQMEHGAVSIETAVPPRLQAEPAVFGGTTGAEVLAEILKRALDPHVALRRLGGRTARIDFGSAKHLLSECALGEAATRLVEQSIGAAVGELLARAESTDFAAVLYALSELGVLQVLASSSRAPSVHPEPTDALDEAALRERIAARKALVIEGDYFAVLGLTRSATSYDVRRAYAQLRRQFEPSRILTAATVDLRDDVDLIVEVLDEAYEVLRDQLRRDRYRRALEAAPH